jgi:hypothetical protein
MNMLAIVTLVLGLGLPLAPAQTPPPAPPAPGPAPSPSAPAKPDAPAPASEVPVPTPAQQSDLLSDLPVMPPEQVERYVSFQTRTLTRMFGVDLQYDGVLPRMRRADRPLHMLNPFAPARYGSGFDNLSLNPVSGRPEGINFFAIRF